MPATVRTAGLRIVVLSDSVWIEVGDNVELYRFFKVVVEMK